MDRGYACPNLTHPGAVINGAATVGAFLTQFSKGVFITSTHGDTHFGRGAGAWGSNAAGAQVVILTREAATAGSILANIGDIMAGRVVIDTGSPPVLAYMPAWVTAKAAGSPMPNSVVGISACRSTWNNTMAAAYLAAGAGYYYGYTDYVASSYAQTRTTAFWTNMLNRTTTGTAFAAMASPNVPDDATDPAFATAQGDATMYLGSGEFTNGGYESGTADWTETGQSSLNTNLK